MTKMTKYIVTWYAGAGYGFRARAVEASSKASAKSKHMIKHPVETKLVGVYTTNEFVRSFYNRNGSKIEYLASPERGQDRRDWNEFMGSHALGMSWDRWPYWAKTLVKKAALERVREGKHVW
jgi:hypothetical protein